MNITINNHNFKTKIVFSHRDTQKGMMGKKFDKSFDGMLFLMGKGDHCFWMKNCITSLDIIFISNNKITKIHHNCPPCKSDDCKNYCGDGDMVLEVPGNTCKRLSIEMGDLIKF